MTLSSRAWLSLAVLALVMGFVLFVTAGTVRYWQGWTYLAVFFASSALLTIFVIRRDPALLERRMSGGPTAEKRTTQKIIMVFTALGFFGLLIVPGLDRRYGWSDVPTFVSWLAISCSRPGSISFSSSTRRTRSPQRPSRSPPIRRSFQPALTPSSGIPMYAGGLLYLLGTPLGLASYWAFVPLAAFLPFLIWRILDEERLLHEQLRGYADYQAKVRYRLLPRVW